MNRTIISTLAGLTTGLGLLFGQGEIPVGTLGFGSATATPKLSGIVLRSNLTGSASANATVRVLLGNSGVNRVTLVEFTIDTNFAAPTTISGIQIRNTTDASQVLEGATSPIQAPAGPATITSTVPAGSAFDATRLIQTPSNYELVLRTNGSAAGALTGPMIPVSQIVAGSSMSGANASATAFVIASVTRSSGAIASAQLEFIVAYQFSQRATPLAATFDKVQILRRDTNALVLDVNFKPVQLPDSGAGKLRFRSAVTLSSSVVAFLNSLDRDPSGYMLSLTSSTGASASGKVQPTDRLLVPAELTVASPTPSTPRADAVFVADVVQGETQADFALVSFNVLHQGYPDFTRFTGLTVFRKPLSDVIDSGLTTNDPAIGGGSPGFGFIGIPVIVPNGGMAPVNRLIESLYASAFFMKLDSNSPTSIEGRLNVSQAGGDVDYVKLSNIAPSVSPDLPTARQVIAPGGLYTITGTFRVAPVKAGSTATSLSGLSVKFQETQNLLEVAPNAVYAQLPFGTALSDFHTVSVTVGSQTDRLSGVRVAASAPAVFVKRSGDSLVAEITDKQGAVLNEVKSADTVVVYATGLGGTNPALKSGKAVPTDQIYNAIIKPTVTIGGVSAEVVSAVAQPGAIGRYMVEIKLPAGLTCESEADQPCYLPLQMGSTSGPVNVAIAK